MRQDAITDVDSAIFSATMKSRNGFIRIQKFEWVKRRFDTPKQIAFKLGKLHTHRINFFDTNSVLASDGATKGNTRF